MGSILVSVPDILDCDLLFDESETRRVLKFFWPHRAGEIDRMTIGNDARRLAQAGLVAAIDGTYALGFVEVVYWTASKPGSNIQSLASRLGRRFVSHWWNHARQRDLDDVRIYDAIRVEVARQLGRRFTLLLEGVALGRGGSSFHAAVGASAAPRS